MTAINIRGYDRARVIQKHDRPCDLKILIWRKLFCFLGQRWHVVYHRRTKSIRWWRHMWRHEPPHPPLCPHWTPPSFSSFFFFFFFKKRVIKRRKKIKGSYQKCKNRKLYGRLLQANDKFIIGRRYKHTHAFFLTATSPLTFLVADSFHLNHANDKELCWRKHEHWSLYA